MFIRNGGNRLTYIGYIHGSALVIRTVSFPWMLYCFGVHLLGGQGVSKETETVVVTFRCSQYTLQSCFTQ